MAEEDDKDTDKVPTTPTKAIFLKSWGEKASASEVHEDNWFNKYPDNGKREEKNCSTEKGGKF